jgi:hypothetical protein
MSLRYNLKNDGNIKTYVYFKPTESNILYDIKLLVYLKLSGILPPNSLALIIRLSNTDLFDNAKVKCTTNFPVTRNNNQFEITVDNSVGYLYLRWNTATAMDVALNKTNRFYREYVVHKI